MINSNWSWLIQPKSPYNPEEQRNFLRQSARTSWPSFTTLTAPREERKLDPTAPSFIPKTILNVSPTKTTSVSQEIVCQGLSSLDLDTKPESSRTRHIIRPPPGFTLSSFMILKPPEAHLKHQREDLTKEGKHVKKPLPRSRHKPANDSKPSPMKREVVAKRHDLHETKTEAAINVKQVDCSIDIEKRIDSILHDKKFRSCCRQVLTDNIDRISSELITVAFGLQEKAYKKNPEKAKINRRYACGLREVYKFLLVKKVTCVILAPDQEYGADNRLDCLTDRILEEAAKIEVPVVFAVNKKQLGWLTRRRAGISCVGVLLDYGSEEERRLTSKLKELVHTSRQEYQDIRSQVWQLVKEEGNDSTGDLVSFKSKCRRSTKFWKTQSKTAMTE